MEVDQKSYNEILALSGSSSDEHVKGIYDKWADNYDQDIDILGYVGYKSCAELFDRTLQKLHGDSRKTLRILDAGAGTGIVGTHLKAMGYTNVDALDISQEMLNKAKEKNVYKNLICAALCEEVISEIATGAYDATVCTGAITVGHVKPPALDEMVRHVKPGGIICFTIRQEAYEKEEYGYRAKMEELEKAKKWHVVSKELDEYVRSGSERLSKCYFVICEVARMKDLKFYEENLVPLTGSSSDEHVKGIYNKWADNYDQDVSILGYVGPKSCAELFDRTLQKLHGDSRKTLRILDAGAGTGVVGANLKEMGYTNVDALDISQEMLNKAKEKNVYKNLICAALCEEVISEIATGAYDATVCCGTITVGHVKPPALDEMVRHVKPGGIICFTIRQEAYEKEEYGYRAKMEELEKAEKWEIVSKELDEYVTNAGERLSKCYFVICKVASQSVNHVS